ncbi:heterokaryon incompatibility [Colletotrichum karsti]|uniref:Heterokaryon incompatibility n=1 Tax=Colletotrichum karsti TaxID=1095194 RepID=A0A9P6LGR2_9PEZI|nr:heterokaryon incompatibility [Colletotrichum karsti]KAF9872461.1 heterokaryon incompatibility [Colletotrichum karsti]
MSLLRKRAALNFSPTRTCNGRLRWISPIPYAEELPRVGWFRLLRVEPADKPTEPMECRLETLRMKTAPPYEALSYTWGNRKADSPITINGHSYLIRKNLHDALVALRQSHSSRTLWIDAICIDQSKDTERSHQVWQMKNIYRDASRVKVWLGNACEGSDRGMDFLRKIDNEVVIKHFANNNDFRRLHQPLLSLIADPKHRPDLEATLDLLRRSWWTRIWTFQESVLGREVDCICGSKEVSISSFSKFSRFVLLCANFGVWHGPSLDASIALRMAKWVGSMRRAFKADGAISLQAALLASWNRASSDPKDKVIGLVGMVDWISDSVPEYGQSVEKIYAAAMFDLLASSKSLGVLGFMSEMPEQRNPKLPSWVPDFEVHSNTGSDHLAALSRDKRAYNASLHSPTGRFPATVERDGSVLVVEGVEFDNVQQIGEKAPGWELLEEPGEEDGAWKRAMRQALDNWRSMADGGVPYPTGEDRARAFWRTVLMDLKQGGIFKSSYAAGSKRLDESDMTWVLSLEKQDALDQLLLAWENACRSRLRRLQMIEQLNRRFFMTARGYFGLGPPSLQAGDSICVLRSGFVAYALRKAADGCWRYVGECYVHGIMDGEVMKGDEEGRPALQTFRIE